jgi:hypothetical protein
MDVVGVPPAWGFFATTPILLIHFWSSTQVTDQKSQVILLACLVLNSLLLAMASPSRADTPHLRLFRLFNT